MTTLSRTLTPVGAWPMCCALGLLASTPTIARDDRYTPCADAPYQGRCGSFCEADGTSIGTSKLFYVVGSNASSTADGKADVWGSGPDFYWHSLVQEAAFFAGLLDHAESGYINVTCVKDAVEYLSGAAHGVRTKQLQMPLGGGGTDAAYIGDPPVKATPGAFRMRRVLVSDGKGEEGEGEEEDIHVPLSNGRMTVLTAMKVGQGIIVLVCLLLCVALLLPKSWRNRGASSIRDLSLSCSGHKDDDRDGLFSEGGLSTSEEEDDGEECSDHGHLSMSDDDHGRGGGGGDGAKTMEAPLAYDDRTVSPTSLESYPDASGRLRIASTGAEEVEEAQQQHDTPSFGAISSPDSNEHLLHDEAASSPPCSPTSDKNGEGSFRSSDAREVSIPNRAALGATYIPKTNEMGSFSEKHKAPAVPSTIRNPIFLGYNQTEGERNNNNVRIAKL